MNYSAPPDPQSGVSPLDFEYVRTLVRKESSISLDAGKTYLVASRLAPLAREHGFGSVKALITNLRSSSHGELHASVVEAIATTETSFFRDHHPFSALREIILPELIRTRQDTTHSLSIWSAACSSGQEPHSVSMMLRDRFAGLQGWNLQLLASDLSSRMVARAREGRYTQLEVNRGLPAPYLIRFFDQKEDQWCLKNDLRSMFRFFRQNLAQDWSIIAPVDILMMRNVLIYFDVDTRRDILRRVRRILKPGGYLLLGSAETTLNLDENFSRVRVDRAVFYQLSNGGRK